MGGRIIKVKQHSLKVSAVLLLLFSHAVIQRMVGFIIQNIDQRVGMTNPKVFSNLQPLTSALTVVALFSRPSCG